MLHPEHEMDPIPDPDGTAQLNIYPFRAQQRYVSFYPYYVPSSYNDYYPKKFGRYYQPVDYVDTTVEMGCAPKPTMYDDGEKTFLGMKCLIPKKWRWPLLIFLIAIAIYLFLR